MKVKIPEGTLFITIEGEGICDFCGKEIIGELTRFVGKGDVCKDCNPMNFIKVNTLAEEDKGEE